MKIFNHCSSLLLYVFAVLVIVAAVTLSLVRLAIPYADDFRQQIAATVSEAVGREIKIAEIDASWRHFKPQIELNDVSILLDNDESIEFNQMALGVDLIGSALEQRLVTHNIRLVGFQLNVLEDLQGKFSLAALPKSDNASNPQQQRQLVRWLSEQKQVVIENGTVYVTSEKRPELLHIFSELSVFLVNSSRGSQLSVNVDLPKEIGGTVELVSNFNGVPLLQDQWSINSYLKSKDVSLSGIETEFFLRDETKRKIQNGRAGFELWAEIDSDQNISGQGYLNSSNLVFSRRSDETGVEALAINKVDADFAIVKEGQKMALAFDQLRIERNSGEEVSLNVQAVYDDSIANRSLLIESDDFELGDILSVVSGSALLPKEQQANLDKAKINAGVNHALLYWGLAEQRTFSANIDFGKLSFEGIENLPDASGLSGSLRYANNQGDLILSGKDSILNADQWLRAPISLDRFNASVNWRRDETGLALSVDDLVFENEDLAMTGTMLLSKQGSSGASSELDLQLDVSRANIAAKSRYLPAKVMPVDSVKWYDRALQRGQIDSGKLMLKGDISKFPFKQGGGEFSVKANITDADLAYAKSWPSLSNIDAVLSIKNQAIEILANQAEIYSTQLSKASVRVADFNIKPAKMKIALDANGPSNDALVFLNNSPLQKRFAHALKVLEFEGENDLSVQLDILIPGKTQVWGQLEFDENTLKVSDDSFVVNDIEGRLSFDEHGLHGSGIKGTIFGMPASTDISPLEEGDKKGTKFISYGEGDMTTYAEISGLPWLTEKASGRSEWKSILTILGGEGELYLESDTVGISSQFPQPFAKRADEVKTFSLETALPFGASTIELSYGKEVLANLELGKEGEDGLALLNVGVNAVPEILAPDASGIVVNGRLRKYVFEEWMAASELFESDDEDTDPLTLDFNLSLDHLDFFGYSWKNIVSRSKFAANNWDISLNGDGLLGNIQVDNSDNDIHVHAELGELMLGYANLPDPPTVQAEEPDELDPHVFPTLDIKVDKFKFNKADFGQVTLKTARSDLGQAIENISISSPNFALNGVGAWASDGGEQRTSFDVTIESNDLADMLAQLDYASDNIEGGDAALNANVHWLGTPTDYSHDKLNGELGLEVKDINFSEIDPGAGRVFGLLSIQALPQRLSLDFSDLFKKGMQVNSIDGNFVVKDGDAITNDLVMLSTAARIDMVGRIGLATQDYDQTLAVTPEVTSSLPIVGAVVAGPAGAGVGAAIMLLHKLFNPKLLHYEYQITGPWEDPQVVLLGNAETQ